MGAELAVGPSQAGLDRVGAGSREAPPSVRNGSGAGLERVWSGSAESCPQVPGAGRRLQFLQRSLERTLGFETFWKSGLMTKRIDVSEWRFDRQRCGCGTFRAQTVISD
ncbi:hypothetical protein AAFF_G00265870 [Aldrovandia affinis]|uniref:Uncharacterized protein n=1 Tax=Aldrovandia affinis TaxID=143900 RepID=A0AAD7RBP4_9TELE|nr:hypothetical protein AAFF_G00265870 [Aldrovandia affinis]